GPPQTLVCDRQLLRQYAGLANGGHEVRIRDPSRQNMHVDMARDTRTRGCAYIHAEIDSVGVIEGAQVPLSIAGEPHHFGKRLRSSIRQGRYMLIRSDHEVPVRV